MCDPCASVLSCASDTLLPLARKHLFQLALDHLLPILKEAVNIIRGVPNNKIAEMKKELETIEVFIHQADKMADSEGANPTDGTREKLKPLIEASFRVQDVIDEYIIREKQQLPDPGCVDGASDYVKTKMLRLQIAHDIQIIKSQINEMKDTSTEKDDGLQIKSSTEQGSTSSATNPNAILLQNLRKAPFYMEEADVVGFEEPKNLLIDWLVNGRNEMTVVSVVGMGGQGKTTLAKIVFDNNGVVQHFDCHVWITVSQQYNIEGLLRDMLYRLYNQLKRQNPPQLIDQMDKDSLVDEVRKCLQKKRYVIVFDDVWNISFWNEIKFALIDNKNGSKVLITTRNMEVVNACKISSFVDVHELKGLNDEQSLELFNRKAFHDLNGCCPENLVDMSSKIVKKCDGLPLAIVVTGGLLSCKNRNAIEWYNFYENIKPKLKKDSVINKILVLSYHDLSYNLKSCLLYFGVYPEDFEVNSKRLTRQWIAEGFIKKEEGMSLEEVAEGYLRELIHRSLVQVVSIKIDGRAKSCRVHDLVHAMIQKKFEDLSLCKNISEDGQSTLTGIARRLSITNSDNSTLESIESSQVRSLLILDPYPVNDSFFNSIPTKYKLLKVLAYEPAKMEFEHVRAIRVPEDFGSLIHLKYFSILKQNGFAIIPKSIGMLENLETLDLTGSPPVDCYHEEFCKLINLRHFLGSEIPLTTLKNGIGGMTSLQSLEEVFLGPNEDVKVIEELGKLEQLKKLGLAGVRRKFMSVLSSSINKMKQMEKLTIKSPEEIDLHLNLPKLRYLLLLGQLEKLPEWIPNLEYLVKLKLVSSKLTEDPMKLLKSMPNLLSISLIDEAYLGETLHFQNGGFKNLKELHLHCLYNLKYIHIDKGTMPSLKKLEIFFTPHLKELPPGIEHLKKLEDYTVGDTMTQQFYKAYCVDEEENLWAFNPVPIETPLQKLLGSSNRNFTRGSMQ